MLVAVLVMALCLSVFVTSRCSIERGGEIKLVFSMDASVNLSYAVL